MAIKVGDKVRVVLRAPPPLAWPSSQAGKVGTVVAVLPEPGLNVHVTFPDENVVWYFADTELRPPDEKQVQLRCLPFICARFPDVERGRIEELFDTRDAALARFAEIEADVEYAAIYYAVGGVETLKDR